MPQFEGVQVWILLALLPFVFTVESSQISLFSPTEDRQNSSDKRAMRGYIGSHCELLMTRGYPPGVYYMDRAFAVKMGWMWGAFEMYCDKAADVGWTVIQRRGQFGDRENFNKSWDDYARGFGDLNSEFWLGNEWIHKLTTDFGPYELRIELEDWNGKVAWAQYSRFSVSAKEQMYSISVDGYAGNATDSLTSNDYKSPDFAPFSTYDHIPDMTYDFDGFLYESRSRAERPQPPCALTYNGGWWYPRPGRCLDANLNGNDNKDQKGESKERISWNGFGGNSDLKSSKMMIRSMVYRSLSKIKSHSEM